MKFLRAKKYYLLASFLVILITLIIYKGLDSFRFVTGQLEPLREVYLVPVDTLPVLREKIITTAEASSEPVLSYQDFASTITAKSAYVEDIDTATVLFERNSDRILLPASTTKLMTMLVALEEFSLDELITVPQLPNILGFKYEFKPGEQLRVRDLVKAALIESSNDAAYILAMSSSKGLDGFVTRMNQKAQELNLVSTHYANPAGFDDPTQRSSAHDLVILSKEFMKNEFLASVVATKEAVITDLSGEYQHYLKSTHHLLGVDPSVVGIKTGTTQGAAQVLITQFNREGHRIIVVVMGSDDRYLETTRIVDWVFRAYRWISPTDLI